ncbi:MAG: hypothetical protein ACMUIM_02300 [bacterium]
MDQTFNIRIGGEPFQIHAQQSHHRTLKRILGDYKANPFEDSCKIRVIPYTHRRRFLWPQPELERFRAFLVKVHARFPANGTEENSVRFTLRILQYLNPKDEPIRCIVNFLDDMHALIYTRLGFNLYFFDINTRTAFFFIKSGSGRLGILDGMIRRFDLKGSGGEDILNGLMFVLSHQLIWHDGLLLHGAAIRKEGDGALFLGLSGAGKSTIAALCAPDVCFSDDGVILKKEGDTIWAYRSPFTQIRHAMKNFTLRKGSIQKGFILEKHDANRLIPAKQHEIMLEILRHFIHFFKFMNDKTAEKAFYLVRDIVDCLPIYRLQFTKNRDIWHDIRQIWEREESNEKGR